VILVLSNNGHDWHGFVLNGVGGALDDSVLVAKGEDLFSFKIN
jgi:hypothetical protein